jgi:hypothetical protein
MHMATMCATGGQAGYVTPDNGKSHEEMTTADALAEIATYAAGVGPWKHALVTIDEAANQQNGKSDLAKRIQAANMQVRFIQRTGFFSQFLSVRMAFSNTVPSQSFAEPLRTI